MTLSYRSFIQSVLAFSIICWCGNLSVSDKNKLKKHSQHLQEDHRPTATSSFFKVRTCSLSALVQWGHRQISNLTDQVRTLPSHIIPPCKSTEISLLFMFFCVFLQYGHVLLLAWYSGSAGRIRTWWIMSAPYLRTSFQCKSTQLSFFFTIRTCSVAGLVQRERRPNSNLVDQVVCTLCTRVRLEGCLVCGFEA